MIGSHLRPPPDPNALYDRNELWRLGSMGISLNFGNDRIFASALRLLQPEHRAAALTQLQNTSLRRFEAIVTLLEKACVPLGPVTPHEPAPAENVGAFI